MTSASTLFCTSALPSLCRHAHQHTLSHSEHLPCRFESQEICQRGSCTRRYDMAFGLPVEQASSESEDLAWAAAQGTLSDRVDEEIAWAQLAASVDPVARAVLSAAQAIRGHGTATNEISLAISASGCIVSLPGAREQASRLISISPVSYLPVLSPPHPVLFCLTHPIPPHPVPSRSIPFHPILSYPISSHLVPSRPIPPRPVPSHHVPSNAITRPESAPGRQ